MWVTKIALECFPVMGLSAECKLSATDDTTKTSCTNSSQTTESQTVTIDLGGNLEILFNVCMCVKYT